MRFKIIFALVGMGVVGLLLGPELFTHIKNGGCGARWPTSDEGRPASVYREMLFEEGASAEQMDEAICALRNIAEMEEGGHDFLCLFTRGHSVSALDTLKEAESHENEAVRLAVSNSRYWPPPPGYKLREARLARESDGGEK